MSARPQGADALTVVDLFCGAGGLSEGFRQVGYEVTAGSDHDPDAVATYAHNFSGARALCGDVRDPSMREQLDEAAAGSDVLVGGPPCQAFSQVRTHTRLLDDPRNSLYREFVRSVDGARPLAFLMENVPGMAQMGVREQVVADLELGGDYRVAAQLVDAADFGVPQTRKRRGRPSGEVPAELDPTRRPPPEPDVLAFRASGSPVTTAWVSRLTVRDGSLHGNRRRL